MKRRGWFFAGGVVSLLLAGYFFMWTIQTAWLGSFPVATLSFMVGGRSCSLSQASYFLSLRLLRLSWDGGESMIGSFAKTMPNLAFNTDHG